MFKCVAYHTTLIITRGPTLLCELGSLFIANTLLLNCAYYKKFISIIPSHYRFVVSIGKKVSSRQGHITGEILIRNSHGPPLPSPSLSLFSCSLPLISLSLYLFPFQGTLLLLCTLGWLTLFRNKKKRRRRGIILDQVV